MGEKRKSAGERAASPPPLAADLGSSRAISANLGQSRPISANLRLFSRQRLLGRLALVAAVRAVFGRPAVGCFAHEAVEEARKLLGLAPPLRRQPHLELAQLAVRLAILGVGAQDL